jgi:hypothetical protein
MSAILRELKVLTIQTKLVNPAASRNAQLVSLRFF